MGFEREIGSTFKHNFSTYQVIPEINGCEGCAFKYVCDCCIDTIKLGHCGKLARSDGRGVIFKKIFKNTNTDQNIPIKNNNFIKECDIQYGDKVFVHNGDNDWVERIFVTYIPNAKTPYVCVKHWNESEFINGDKYGICSWAYCRKQKPEVVKKVTMEEIAAKFDADRIEIV